ncbi:MAG: peptidyl-prolyl cis-trans isomerase [Planctomycetaceae bacterium]|nr:peptidyl-prolyl cis-trans isomerase [Planctomycetaceae bacterium]
MRRISPLLALVIFTGCSGRSYDVADPVVGPAPPRVADADLISEEADTSEESSIVQVNYEDGPLLPTAVVATVNGRPVLAGEVLEQYEGKLRQMRPQMGDQKYREMQLAIIKRDLPDIMEQRLMSDAVKAKLTREQLDTVENQLDIFFEQEVDRLKKQFEVESLADLEATLQEQGTSLSTMRRIFGERQLAGEYVRARMGEDSPVSRQELLEVYQANLDEYSTPAQVKWQQLQISVAKTGSRQEAAAKMELALSELRQGASFDEVVKKHSDGALAANGGHWDWTQPESIANRQVRDVLNELPEDRLSNVIASDNLLQILKVTGRRKAGHTPFGDVQEQLRKQVIEERRAEKAQQIVEELKTQAITTTIFGDDFFLNAESDGKL